jgi:hypothetical protein
MSLVIGLLPVFFSVSATKTDRPFLKNKASMNFRNVSVSFSWAFKESQNPEFFSPEFGQNVPSSGQRSAGQRTQLPLHGRKYTVFRKDLKSSAGGTACRETGLGR